MCLVILVLAHGYLQRRGGIALFGKVISSVVSLTTALIRCYQYCSYRLNCSFCRWPRQPRQQPQLRRSERRTKTSLYCFWAPKREIAGRDHHRPEGGSRLRCSSAPVACARSCTASAGIGGSRESHGRSVKQHSYSVAVAMSSAVRTNHSHLCEVQQTIVSEIRRPLFNEGEVGQVHAQVRYARRVCTMQSVAKVAEAPVGRHQLL